MADSENDDREVTDSVSGGWRYMAQRGGVQEPRASRKPWFKAMDTAFMFGPRGFPAGWRLDWSPHTGLKASTRSSASSQYWQALEGLQAKSDEAWWWWCVWYAQGSNGKREQANM